MFLFPFLNLMLLAQLDATLTEQMKHLSQDEISTVYEKVPQQTVAKLGSSGR